jgi:hypothetical protein
MMKNLAKVTETTLFFCVVFFGLVHLARADGPQDNLVDKVRRIPPPGIALSEEDRQELTAGVQALGKEMARLHAQLKAKPALQELLPDVQIYYNAVHFALAHDEFFKAPEIGIAKKLLQQGMQRAKDLAEGQAPWTTATGLVVRGYISRIDGSVQPYGLVIPASYRPETAQQHRLDIWFHGRGETLSELNFLEDRQKNPGQFTPAHAFVLHPYGRYCNANHFAGEVDTFEALEHVQRHYAIDENRIAVRGFSMGGAACWHFAVHHAWRWAAAAPGAGFSETPDFLKVFQNETLQPTWYEMKLWHLYDCNDYALNLYHCPLVAYSGTKDKQKQAADIMEAAMKKVGLDLVHVLGPDTAHSYHPAAKVEINRRIDSIVTKGRDPMPHKIRFNTWTLRYPRMHWVTIEGMEKHWERARVDADIWFVGSTLRITTQNVDAFTLDMAPGYCPLDPLVRPRIIIDQLTYIGLGFQGPPVRSDRSWTAHFRKKDKEWTLVPSLEDGVLRKRPGLQGPIDDAFMDRFVMVRPTGKPLNSKVEKWVKEEMKHASEHWRRQFRGEAPVMDDTQIRDEDIVSSNLILWGDPHSNKVLAKIAAKLPIGWSDSGVSVEGKAFDAGHHVPVLIYPNPLNPKKYIVINSGFTFREYDYLNNARQVPKLPDWAILDINQPTTSRAPAGIVNAGFFDENWK